MKTVYADTLVELMKENENVVCLEADLGRSSGTFPKIKDMFPDRFIDVGVAEANMVSVSAGLANDGKIPFCASFSAFAARRAYDQSTISVAYSDNNVKIVGLSPGITATYNGGTHMCLQDLAIMRAMPNMHVYSPCDTYELRAVMRYMAKEKQPTYLQMMREKYPAVFDDSVTFDPAKAKLLREGSDLTIVTTGYTTQLLKKTWAMLDEAGVKFEHLHYPSVKPFDSDAVVKSAKKTGAVLTVETQTVIGGLGGAVCETLSELYPVPVKRLGAQDRFGEVGNIDYLAEAMGFSPKQIVETAVGMKKKG
jgi:transketolase